ncbi:fibrinogen alpha chain-like isoform X2 [Vanacampus margaritifer]
MQRPSLLACLGLLCAIASLASGLDPRGARPVVPNTRSEKCATEKEWPFCTDDDWGPKCPSGCRIQGLMDFQDHSLLKKIEKIRSLVEQNQLGHRSADQVTKQTYDYLKEKLTVNSGQDDRYYNLAQSLRQRISDMKVKIDQQLRHLATLRDRVSDQVADLQKLEVDIDIKLRSCKGSCEKYSEYQVDHAGYVSLDKQMNQLQAQQAQGIESVRQLEVMQSRPLQEVLQGSTIYKSKGTKIGQQDIFHEVNSFQLILEAEGSSSSPATISKVPACARSHIQHGRRQTSLSSDERRCPARSDVPPCSHGDWGRTCPSGCRLQAVLSQADMEADGKLDAFCKTAKKMEAAFEEFMAKVVNVYRHHRRVLVIQHVSELKFVQDAAELAKNLTSLRQRSWQLRQRLEELNERVQRQVEELWRAEVDVDMKLRACGGSCRTALPFSIDRDGYRTLRADLAEFDRQRNRKKAPPPPDIPQIKLRPVLVGPPPSKTYKQIPAVRSELLTQFEDIGQNQLYVEKSENGKNRES